jgi:hypothetical protein
MNQVAQNAGFKTGHSAAVNSGPARKRLREIKAAQERGDATPASANTSLARGTARGAKRKQAQGTEETGTKRRKGVATAISKTKREQLDS